jgi:phosphoesterase RecJ-like protein
MRLQVAFFKVFMEKFLKEFNTLNYVIKEADKILLFAHSRPDGDTVGAVLALKEYFNSLGKEAVAACFDPLPEYLSILTKESFVFPEQINLGEFKLIIACDSVERGFEKIKKNLREDQIVALLDHHPDISLQGDINIIDSEYSSVCEIVFDLLSFNRVEIDKKIANYLLLGIVGDTGIFQHSNTTPKIMQTASVLMKKGASLSKLVEAVFVNKKISTLKLWGRAFEKAKINSENGMITSVLTIRDLEECDASLEDINQVAGILDTVPGARFALVLSEREGGIIKGSLRSEEYKGVDVSRIAAEFGGGGHKLASGFEIKGKIVETEKGWKII